MEEFYLDIRGIHIGAVVLSGSLFLIRVIGHNLLNAKWPMASPLRFIVWSVDTVLLTAALMLMTIVRQPVQPRRPLAADDLVHRPSQTAQGRRRLPVGPDPEGIGLLGLEQRRGLLEPLGHRQVHRGRASVPGAAPHRLGRTIAHAWRMAKEP